MNNWLLKQCITYRYFRKSIEIDCWLINWQISEIHNNQSQDFLWLSIFIDFQCYNSISNFEWLVWPAIAFKIRYISIISLIYHNIMLSYLHSMRYQDKGISLVITKTLFPWRDILSNNILHHYCISLSSPHIL